MWTPRHREGGRPSTAQFAPRPVSIQDESATRRGRGDATVELVTADLISRARAGDGDAFRELAEPHRRELQVHCYRMRGSFQDAEDGSPPAPGSPSEDAMVAKFVRAWESADLDALVALVTDDVFVSMPPMPLEYGGRDVVARFCASLFRSGRRFDLVPTRANGQPAFGAYLRAPGGISHGMGLYVLTLTGDRICAMTRFENSVLLSFGLPRSLPGP